jgi:hypothetical protein
VGQGAGGKAAKVQVKARRRIAPEAASIAIEVIDNDGNPDPNPRVKPESVVSIRVTVADSSGVAIGNHRLQFKVEARDVDVEVGHGGDKTIALTPNQRNNREEARKAIRQAYIDTGAKVNKADSVSKKFKPIGTLNRRKTRTASNGTVFVRYRAPRIGGNQAQPAVDAVKVTSAPKPQLTTECRIELSCNLVEVTAQRGFRIDDKAFGRYATQNVRDNLIQAGEAWFNEVLAARQNAPDSNRDLADQTIPEEFTITALNLRHGGVYPPHKGHRDGLGVDVRPINAGGEKGRWKIKVKKKWRKNPNYKRAATSKLVNIFRQNGAKKIFFNDPKIPNVTPLGGHDDHLHVNF